MGNAINKTRWATWMLATRQEEETATSPSHEEEAQDNTVIVL